MLSHIATTLCKPEVVQDLGPTCQIQIRINAFKVTLSQINNINPGVFFFFCSVILFFGTLSLRPPVS